MSNWYATDANGDEFASKKALREFVAANPDDVRLTDTSAFNSRGTLFGIDEIRGRGVEVIVGPNPWTNRKWYATVDAKGRVK